MGRSFCGFACVGEVVGGCGFEFGFKESSFLVKLFDLVEGVLAFIEGGFGMEFFFRSGGVGVVNVGDIGILCGEDLGRCFFIDSAHHQGFSSVVIFILACGVVSIGVGELAARIGGR